MNIVHLIPRFPYFGNETVVGGAANALFNLAREQSKTHSVKIIAEMPGVDSLSHIGSQNLNIVPLTMYSPVSSIGFGLEYTARIIWEAFKHRKTFRVVHGHSGYLDYVMASAALSRVAGVPAIHTLYCPVDLTESSSKYPGRNTLRRLIAGQIDLFIAISENVAQSLRHAGIPGQKVRLIRPAVNLDRFSANYDQSEARLEFGIPADALLVLFVGNTKPNKNLEGVLDAMALVVQKLPQALLIITTELEHANHQSREQLLSSQIKTLGLEQHVIKQGIIKNMPKLMAASDILVAPFLNTYGPSDYFLAALEAMAVGRPVVVSAVGGMPELVDTEVGYLVSPQDIEGIAKALINILQNPERRNTMGQAASSRIKQLFHPKLIAHKVQAVYDEVLRV